MVNLTQQTRIDRAALEDDYYQRRTAERQARVNAVLPALYRGFAGGKPLVQRLGHNALPVVPVSNGAIGLGKAVEAAAGFGDWMDAPIEVPRSLPTARRTRVQVAVFIGVMVESGPIFEGLGGSYETWDIWVSGSLGLRQIFSGLRVSGYQYENNLNNTGPGQVSERFWLYASPEGNGIAITLVQMYFDDPDDIGVGEEIVEITLSEVGLQTSQSSWVTPYINEFGNAIPPASACSGWVYVMRSPGQGGSPGLPPNLRIWKPSRNQVLQLSGLPSLETLQSEGFEFGVEVERVNSQCEVLGTRTRSGRVRLPANLPQGERGPFLMGLVPY